MASITPQTNGESWYMKEEEDTDPEYTRTLYRCERCPAEGCSAKAWKRGRCWSWESEDQCRAYIAGHLRWSDLHKDLEKSAREDLVMAATITEDEQTYEEREAEREAFRADEMRKARHEREAASKGKTKGGGGKGSKGVGKGVAKGGGKGGVITPFQPSVCLQDYVCCTAYACVH